MDGVVRFRDGRSPVQSWPARVGSVVGALAIAACAGEIGAVSGEANGADGPTPGPGGAADDPVATPPDLAVPPDPATCALPPTRLWALTPSQLALVAGTLWPGVVAPPVEVLSDARSFTGRFRNNAEERSMTVPYVEGVFALATDLATQGLADPRRLRDCLGDDPAATLGPGADDPCLRGLLADVGARAFRRPLAEDELDRYAGFYGDEVTAGGDPARALANVIRALALSPAHLFRTELGDADAYAAAAGDEPLELGAYERASALSFFLTDGPPDEALLEAARTGALGNVEGIARETRRLLEDPASAVGVRRFFGEYLFIDDVLEVAKDEARFPAFEDARASLADETHRFVAHVLWEGDGTLETLLTAPYTVVDETAADFYGLPWVGGAGFARLDYPEAQERAGVLSHASFLAVQAQFDESDAVKRGRFIREELLCQPLPPPPPDVEAVFPAPDGVSTQRERLARHSVDPSCAVCHDKMDPLGFGLEPFDAVGRHRAEEVGKPIDASGELLGTSATATAFDGPVGLAARLTAAPETAACFVTRVHEYAMGRPGGSRDACMLHDLALRFRDSGGDVVDLFVTITTHPSFFTRRKAVSGDG